jgi:precorrin-8X/cobalt-precorrin-8 methylmutase
MSTPRYDYLRDPDAIYRASFEATAGDANFAHLPEEARPLATRIVHAGGDPSVAGQIDVSNGAIAAGQAALAAGAPVLADSRMLAAGITRGFLPAGNRIVCTLGLGQVAGAAKRTGTTRSAAAVELWEPFLAGAVVAIGNAPTALFRLLEGLADGWPAPALIVGMPVGYVGAAEAKAALAEAAPAPFVTLYGRHGGSALAAAAVNALARGVAAP